jgi:hypothetical protein
MRHVADAMDVNENVVVADFLYGAFEFADHRRVRDI